MAVSNINSVNGNTLADILLNSSTKTDASSTDVKFSDILNSLLNPVEEAEALDEISSQQLITGEAANFHDVMITSEKAELVLRLTLQVRNKVVDAYNEVMRMSV